MTHMCCGSQCENKTKGGGIALRLRYRNRTKHDDGLCGFNLIKDSFEACSTSHSWSHGAASRWECGLRRVPGDAHWIVNVQWRWIKTRTSASLSLFRQSRLRSVCVHLMTCATITVEVYFRYLPALSDNGFIYLFWKPSCESLWVDDTESYITAGFHHPCNVCRSERECFLIYFPQGLGSNSQRLICVCW